MFNFEFLMLNYKKNSVIQMNLLAGTTENTEAFAWGKSVVKNLAEDLQKEFVGIKGFLVQNLWNMRLFYLTYVDNQKLQTLSREYEKFLLNQTNFDETVPQEYNDQARLAVKDENPSIGIIICKDKSRTTVEYALRDSNKPIGVSSYHILEKLPQELKSFLPSSEEIAERLSVFDIEGNG